MPMNRFIREGDNPDITEERLKATFDTEELAVFVWGSRETVRRRREIAEKISSQFPQLEDSQPLSYLDRYEKYEEGCRKASELTKVIHELIESPDELMIINSEVLGIEGHPLAIHGVAFMPALNSQASDDQQEWFAKAVTQEHIGTYAQTELGHGTNLRKLETTATYDKSTQEFVLNSPTITSLKWWPGNMGKSANVIVATAMLHIDGTNYGAHNFFVPIRDPDTHLPLKGIEVGDIGPKMAFNGSDNGFLRFDHVRIPRTNMLMRHAKVTPEGTYIRPPHAKLSYTSMVHVRSQMIASQSQLLANALTIALRYSAIRRQGEITPGAGEVKILDYQTQQYRLLPSLARAFAMKSASFFVKELFDKVFADIQKSETSHLTDLHAITSGLKAVVSFQCGFGIEQARMSCGGHGYSKASNLGEIYGFQIAGCTYEGENMVMLQQLARYLMKAVERARGGEVLGSTTAYLQEVNQRNSLIGSTANGKYLQHLAAFEQISRKQIFAAYERMQKLIRSGMTKEDAWNANTVELNRAARFHTRLFIAKSFYERVGEIVDGNVRDVMNDMLHLHLNYELVDMAAFLQEDGFVTSDQIVFMKEDMYRLLTKLRPNAVSLVDGWEFTDRELRSVLGRRDGNVYENLYKWAKGSKMNREQVPSTFRDYLQPMMERGRESKL